MRRILHPRVIEPMVEVREQRDGFEVAGDAEEVARGLRRETPYVHPQRWIEVVLHGQQVLVFEKRHVLRHGRIRATRVLLWRRRCRQWGQAAIALLFEP